MMSLKSYDSYKNSNISIIGEIPSHWEIEKLKYISNVKPSNVDKKSKNNEPQVLLCNYTDVYNNEFITMDLDFMKATASFDQIRKLSLNIGDIIITKDSESAEDIAVPAIVTEELENVVCGYHLAIIQPTKENIHPKFLFRSFESNNINKQFELGANGVTRFGLGTYPISNAYICLPPLSEQKNIADYLDKKISKIEETIAKNKKLIQLLEEKNIALINHIATKGLNPNVSMKYSGIEWIGNIPSHWELKKFRNVLKERNKKNNPIKSKERLSLSIDKGVTLYAEKTTNLDRFKEDFTQYKLAYEGDLVLNSMNMIVGAVGVSNYFGCVSPVYYTYYDDTIENITTIYYDYLFKTKTIKKFLRSLGNGIMSIDRGDDKINTCRLKISRDDLRNMYMPYPPLIEQKEINTYLNKESEKIVKTISVVAKHIELLEEYKNSLIYHIVTGKVDVRGENI